MTSEVNSYKTTFSEEVYKLLTNPTYSPDLDIIDEDKNIDIEFSINEFISIGNIAKQEFLNVLNSVGIKPEILNIFTQIYNNTQIKYDGNFDSIAYAGIEYDSELEIYRSELTFANRVFNRVSDFIARNPNIDNTNLLKNIIIRYITYHESTHLIQDLVRSLQQRDLIEDLTNSDITTVGVQMQTTGNEHLFDLTEGIGFLYKEEDDKSNDLTAEIQANSVASRLTNLWISKRFPSHSNIIDEYNANRYGSAEAIFNYVINSKSTVKELQDMIDKRLNAIGVDINSKESFFRKFNLRTHLAYTITNSDAGLDLFRVLSDKPNKVDELFYPTWAA